VRHPPKKIQPPSQSDLSSLDTVNLGLYRNMLKPVSEVHKLAPKPSGTFEVDGSKGNGYGSCGDPLLQRKVRLRAPGSESP
jgi:hypothetical protein